jgi:hypothetical protein
MQSKMLHAKNALSRAEARYTESQSSLKIIHDYLSDFKDLESNHFLNGEQRLMGWINDLQILREILKLPSLSYSFEQPQPYEMPSVKMEEKFKVYVSKLELTVSLWHSRDLFILLDKLSESHIEGLFMVEQCQLRRIGSINSIGDWRKNPNRTNLDVTCTLQWYTARISQNEIN